MEDVTRGADIFTDVAWVRESIYWMVYRIRNDQDLWLELGDVTFVVFLLLCFSYPSLPSTAMNTWGPKGLRICCPKHFSCRHHPVLRTIFNVDPCQCPQDRADMIPQCLGVVWNHDSVSPGIQITNPVCHQ